MKKKVISENSGLFFRGTMNDWSCSNEFQQLSDGSYVCRNVEMICGTNEFKIASADWSEEYGYAGKLPVMLYHNYMMNYGTVNAMMIAHESYTVDVFMKKIDSGDVQIRMIRSKN